MTNKIAVWLGLIVFTVLAADYFVGDWQNSIYVGRKLLDFIEYVAFWR